MVFLGGPRQVGKTTLAQEITAPENYLNWDSDTDREKILRNELPKSGIITFDEIHKYKKWRNYLKGFFDKNRKLVQILVTGSARLDLYRRGGDSLQGRYHYLRLHPLSLDELGVFKADTVSSLLQLGGFPEPFLSGKKIDAQRWSREYRTRLFREDILSIETIEDVGQAEKLMLELPLRVGSPLSINALREDLQVDFKTIQRWLNLFENFYGIYRLKPMGSSVLKTVKKEQKHYHYDWTLIKDEGSRFENFIASHLLKWCHFHEDTEGREIELRFYKDREQREVDFVITEDQKPICFVETKLSEKSVSPHLSYLKRKFPKVPAYQITLSPANDFLNNEGIRVAPAHVALKEIITLLT
jgi:predicted AAA+ superfamily ATPase